MGRILLMATMLATGCDVVFDLDGIELSPDAPPVFDACAGQPIDRSARYAFVMSPTPLIQSTALDACKVRGMGLVSINDAAELAELEAEIQIRLNTSFIYIGTNDSDLDGTWVGADGCPAHQAFAPGEPGGGTIEDCVAIAPDGMFDGPCDQRVGGFINIRIAACEVGRWPSEACLAAAVTPGALSFDPTPRTLDAATTLCAQSGSRVIEIESSAELDAARALAGTTFWLGARHTARLWRRESGVACPQILPWRTGEPAFATGSECAAVAAGRAEIRACTDTVATICER